MPRRRSLSRCAVNPRIEEPSKVRLSSALEQKFLVVVQHVQAAFEIAEQHGHGLDALFVGQVLEPLFLNLIEATRLSCAASFAFRFSSSSSSYESARKLRSSVGMDIVQSP